MYFDISGPDRFYLETVSDLFNCFRQRTLISQNKSSGTRGIIPPSSMLHRLWASILASTLSSLLKMASSTQNKHAMKSWQYKLVCFLIITFVIAYHRKVLQEKVSSFLAIIKVSVLLFAFVAFVEFCIKASEQADFSKSPEDKSNRSQQGAQGGSINNNSGSNRGASSTAYRGQGVGSTYNSHREAGTRATSSSGSTFNDGGTAPKQARNTKPTRPDQPNGYYGGDPYSPFSANHHAQNLPGLAPELSHLYQQSIDAINRQYHRDMDRIKRQHSYALNQNQLAFEHQHQLYMQQQEQRRQQEQRWQEEQARRRQWQHYQQRQSQESRPKPRRSSRSSRLRKYYDILGIRSDASASGIRQAYRKGALRWHPDKPGGCGEKFRQLQEAYEILSADRERRSSG